MVLVNLLKMMTVFHYLNQEKVLMSEGVLLMKKQHVDRRVPVLFAVIIIVSMVLILAGAIFAATILNSKQLPTEQTLKGRHRKREVQYTSV